VEGALKLACRATGRAKFVSTSGSFHGRTLGALGVIGQARPREPYRQILQEPVVVPFGDAEAACRALDDRSAAFVVEPVQGEGGVNVPPPGYLAAVRQRCREVGALLVFDEVQTGIGRTGELFAYQTEDVRPDIISLAKGLGSGFPIGAMLASEPTAASFTAGSHGSTFGGNALASAVALAVLETIERDQLLDNCKRMGARLLEGLQGLAGRGVVESARGRGLLVAAVLNEPGAAAVDRCRERGLIINTTGCNVLRLAPPLTVSADEVDRALEILAEVLVP